MKKPKIIFVDLDGTTLDTQEIQFWKRSVTEYTQKVVKELQKTISVVISTGRGVSERTMNIARLLGSESYIAWNGAKTVDNGVIISEEFADKEVSQELFDEIAKNKCVVIYNSDTKNKTFASNWFYRFIMKRTGVLAKKYSEYKNDFDMYKAFVRGVSKKKILKLEKEWSKKFEGRLTVTLTGDNNSLEITRVGVSKGDAEVKYCLLKGIDPKDAVHFGDSMNDASTKGKIGKLIAMQNSVQELKDIADDITQYTCAESGLAKYLEKYLD
ncbi:HAD-IIB family hydrolase [Mycoplasma leonicaptivi]|uniref:HAD-IIB family hydrolase n=1 Tax=Mycoplasma leonicaptivi TaxID=36742 RepID=UPI0004851620|nr:HAD family hydrolase [Mycoplasma leonicaptivi]